mmetsp:Transcript_40719/g.53416  ORF Transcript_40719/g.53416 Transcript_40719/m.53416 type:complete len:82 (-) Transcript_40719:586-831(-)
MRHGLVSSQRVLPRLSPVSSGMLLAPLSIQGVRMQQMSTFFKDMDKQSRFEMGWERQVNKEYKQITDRWKKPFEKKQLKKM